MSRPVPQASIETIDFYKDYIQDLYENHPSIQLNITLTHAKVVQNARAAIVGVYRHCFCVEEKSCGVPQRHTFTYADLMTQRVSVQVTE